MKEIWLAGGCYWGVEKYMASLRGVLATEVGFANGSVSSPAYEEVRRGDTGHAETVHVAYDEALIPLPNLLRLFLRVIDPLSLNRQGGDVGIQYRTGIYWRDPEDEAAVREALDTLSASIGKPLAVEALPLRCFYPAEAYHQKYLDKNPGGYCHIPWTEIRWAQTVDPLRF